LPTTSATTGDRGDADRGVAQRLEPGRQVDPEQQTAEQRDAHHVDGDSPACGQRQAGEDQGDDRQPPEGELHTGQIGALGDHSARTPARRGQQDRGHTEPRLGLRWHGHNLIHSALIHSAQATALNRFDEVGGQSKS
jgi:hypothetical protein